MFPNLTEIKRIREHLNWSQLKLAERVGISQSAITKYENGSQVPSYSIAKKIFSVLFDEDIQLDPSVDELMTSSVVTVNPRTKLSKALKLMRSKSLSQLPVTDYRTVVGTISESIALDLFDSFQDLDQAKNIVVGKIMGQTLPTVPGKTKLREVTPLLRRYGAVLILKNGALSGILTKADLLDA